MESPEMNESDRTNPPQGWQGHGPDSIEERRRILRSLGAGGAIAGLPSLASATSTRPFCKKDAKNYNPTASAVGSMVGSMVGSTPPMYGHPCSHYQNQTGGSWGSTWHNGYGRLVNWTTAGNKGTADADRLRFWVAFGHTSDPGGNKSRSCAYLLHDYASSDEVVWLTALLNANKCGTRFPYTPKGVVDLYNNKNPLTGGSIDATLHGKAFILFRDYLSLGMPA
jgi:hypothetical protein